MRIPQPATGDVVDVIIEDHRLFEELLRELRDVTCDRAAARSAMADLLVAHGEAEEDKVFPSLVRNRAISDDDAEHSVHSHEHVNAALLALLEADIEDEAAFGVAVNGLAAALGRHIGEEELTILNHARLDTRPETRARLGKYFLEVRNARLEKGAGSLEEVRELLSKHSH